MTANIGLVAFLFAFWGLLWVSTRVGNFLSGRRFNDGPSFVPLVPVLPLLLFGVGVLVNLGISPWGTIGVAAIHFGWLAVTALLIWTNSRKRTNEKK